MNNCNMFTGSIDWMTRNLERADPDLQGATKPRRMTEENWQVILANRDKYGESSKGQEAQLAMLVDTMSTLR